MNMYISAHIFVIGHYDLYIRGDDSDPGHEATQVDPRFVLPRVWEHRQ